MMLPTACLIIISYLSDKFIFERLSIFSQSCMIPNKIRSTCLNYET